MSPVASGALSSRPDLDEVLGRDGEADRVADRLVEAVVGAVAEDHRLRMVVFTRVEVMPELVVNRREVFRRRIDAHLDAQVVHVVDVPRARVTDDLTIARLHEQRSLPERLRQRIESDRREEALTDVNHLLGLHVSSLEDVVKRYTTSAASGRDEVVDVRPVLRPDVAEQMRGNRSVGWNGVTVLRVQLRADVGVQRQIQRPQLLPQAIEFLARSPRAACRIATST